MTLTRARLVELKDDLQTQIAELDRRAELTTPGWDRARLADRAFHHFGKVSLLEQLIKEWDDDEEETAQDT